MAELPDADRSNLEPLQQLWDVHNEILRQRGIDLNELLMRWVRKQKEEFKDPHSKIEFEELCSDGCAPQVLSLLLSFIRNSPKLSGFWTLIVGDAKSRRAVSNSLDMAAAALEGQFKEVVADDSEEQRKQFEELGRIPLSTLVAELRLYVSFINMAEELKIEVETRSVEEFARFLLTDYVGRSTGRFHDRNIATLFGDVKGLEAYEEAAQRMWRERNYDRLVKYHKKIGSFLLVIGAVIARQT
jgi:hypothetical protein